MNIAVRKKKWERPENRDILTEMLIDGLSARVCEVDDVSSALTLNFQILLAKYAR